MNPHINTNNDQGSYCAYTIEKNIPMPVKWQVGTNKRDFPNLEIEESFFIEGSDHVTQNICQQAVIWAKNHGQKFATRKSIKDGKIGRRVWRIE